LENNGFTPNEIFEKYENLGEMIHAIVGVVGSIKNVV